MLVIDGADLSFLRLLPLLRQQRQATYEKYLLISTFLRALFH